MSSRRKKQRTEEEKEVSSDPSVAAIPLSPAVSALLEQVSTLPEVSDVKPIVDRLQQLVGGSSAGRLVHEALSQRRISYAGQEIELFALIDVPASDPAVTAAFVKYCQSRRQLSNLSDAWLERLERQGHVQALHDVSHHFAKMIRRTIADAVDDEHEDQIRTNRQHAPSAIVTLIRYEADDCEIRRLVPDFIRKNSTTSNMKQVVVLLDLLRNERVFLTKEEREEIFIAVVQGDFITSSVELAKLWHLMVGYMRIPTSTLCELLLSGLATSRAVLMIPNEATLSLLDEFYVRGEGQRKEVMAKKKQKIADSIAAGLRTLCVLGSPRAAAALNMCRAQLKEQLRRTILVLEGRFPSVVERIAAEFPACLLLAQVLTHPSDQMRHLLHANRQTHDEEILLGTTNNNADDDKITSSPPPSLSDVSKAASRAVQADPARLREVATLVLSHANREDILKQAATNPSSSTGTKQQQGGVVVLPRPEILMPIVSWLEKEAAALIVELDRLIVSRYIVHLPWAHALELSQKLVERYGSCEDQGPHWKRDVLDALLAKLRLVQQQHETGSLLPSDNETTTKSALRSKSAAAVTLFDAFVCSVRLTDFLLSLLSEADSFNGRKELVTEQLRDALVMLLAYSSRFSELKVFKWTHLARLVNRALRFGADKSFVFDEAIKCKGRWTGVDVRMQLALELFEVFQDDRRCREALLKDVAAAHLFSSDRPFEGEDYDKIVHHFEGPEGPARADAVVIEALFDELKCSKESVGHMLRHIKQVVARYPACAGRAALAVAKAASSMSNSDRDGAFWRLSVARLASTLDPSCAETDKLRFHVELDTWANFTSRFGANTAESLDKLLATWFPKYRREGGRYVLYFLRYWSYSRSEVLALVKVLTKHTPELVPKALAVIIAKARPTRGCFSSETKSVEEDACALLAEVLAPNGDVLRLAVRSKPFVESLTASPCLRFQSVQQLVDLSLMAGEPALLAHQLRHALTTRDPTVKQLPWDVVCVIVAFAVSHYGLTPWQIRLYPSWETWVCGSVAEIPPNMTA